MLRALNPNQNTIDLLLSIENKQKKRISLPLNMDA